MLFYNPDTPDLNENKYAQAIRGQVDWRGVLAWGTGALSRPLETVPHAAFLSCFPEKQVCGSLRAQAGELKPESALEAD